MNCPGYPWTDQNKLVIVAIKKYENNQIFQWSHLIFCNSNIVALSTSDAVMHRVGQVVASLMVVERGTIVVAPIDFLIAVRLSQQEWNMIALA